MANGDAEEAARLMLLKRTDDCEDSEYDGIENHVALMDLQPKVLSIVQRKCYFRETSWFCFGSRSIIACVCMCVT